MANADKFVDAGYQNALKFDPTSGIIKYGNFEFFADQVGVKPQTSKVTFDQYRESLRPARSPMSAMSNMLYRQPLPALSPEAEAKVRTEFADAVTSGKFGGQPTIAQAVSFRGGIPALPSHTKYNQVDANTFEINRYSVPNDINFINRLSDEAGKLASNAALYQTTAGENERKSGATGRLGKPNYSRAGTVLAGESAPLGGAATTLGA